MGVGFHLEGGVVDPVVVLKEAAGLVENRVGICGGGSHEVDGGDIHLGGECPHVEVVHVDHSWD